MSRFKIGWTDGEATAIRPADPAFPNGRDVQEHEDASPTCFTKLTYPAPRIGVWEITCRHCGGFACVTVGGIADDPRSFRMTCRGDGK
jgi:hypothetical protein